MASEQSPLLNGEQSKDAITPVEEKKSIDWMFFWITQIGVFIAMMDDSFVMSSHEQIASTFNHLSAASWLVTSYTLGFATTLPIYGRLSDIYGCKKILLCAYFIFAIGCAVTGTAASIWMAIAGRLITGFGGAGVIDLVSLLVVDMAPLKDVAVLRSYTGMTTTVAITSGAPIGGLLIDLIGWRYSFMFQIPLIIICFISVVWRSRRELRENATNKTNDIEPSSSDESDRNLDLFGIFTLVIAITGFMLFCDSSSKFSFWGSPEMFILLGVTLISGAIFAANENYWATDPVMPFWLLKTNGIGIASLGQALVMVPQFGLISITAEFLIRTENASNKFVGINLLPVAIGCTIGAVSSGRIIKATGRYKALSLVSLGIAASSYLLILLRWPRISNGWEMIYPFIAGIGIGGLLSTQFVALTVSSPPKMSATAITIYNLSQQVGKMFGVTLTAAVSRSLFEKDLVQKLGNYPENMEIIIRVLQDVRFASTLPQNLWEIVRSSFLQAFTAVAAVWLGFIVLPLPFICLLQEHRLE